MSFLSKLANMSFLPKRLTRALFGPPKAQLRVTEGQTDHGRTFTEVTLNHSTLTTPLLRCRIYSDGCSQLISSGTLHIHSDGQLQISAVGDLHLAHPVQQRTTQSVDPSPVANLTRVELLNPVVAAQKILPTPIPVEIPPAIGDDAGTGGTEGPKNG